MNIGSRSRDAAIAASVERMPARKKTNVRLHSSHSIPMLACHCSHRVKGRNFFHEDSRGVPIPRVDHQNPNSVAIDWGYIQFSNKPK